jgi:uncharacterized phage protein (TIGR02220 family)
MSDKAEIFADVISYLEEVTGRDYSAARINADVQRSIYVIIDDGYTLEQLNSVIDKKYQQWKGTKYEQFVRPETLFGDKFKIYLNERIINRQTSIGKLNNAVQGAKRALWFVGKKHYTTDNRTDF